MEDREQKPEAGEVQQQAGEDRLQHNPLRGSPKGLADPDALRGMLHAATSLTRIVLNSGAVGAVVE
jgi:hypothetical protein